MDISDQVWFLREMNTFKKIHIEKTTVEPTPILVGQVDPLISLSTWFSTMLL